AHPCVGNADQWSRTSPGEMVQSTARLRISHPRRGYRRHFRAYGNLAAVLSRRAAPRAIPAGPLLQPPPGADGGGGTAGRRCGPFLPLTALQIRLWAAGDEFKPTFSISWHLISRGSTRAASTANWPGCCSGAAAGVARLWGTSEGVRAPAARNRHQDGGAQFRR